MVFYGGMLLTQNVSASGISAYDVNTGALLDGSFIGGLQNPDGLFLDGTHLYVSNSGRGTVDEYDVTNGDPHSHWARQRH